MYLLYAMSWLAAAGILIFIGKSTWMDQRQEEDPGTYLLLELLLAILAFLCTLAGMACLLHGWLLSSLSTKSFENSLSFSFCSQIRHK